MVVAAVVVAVVVATADTAVVAVAQVVEVEVVEVATETNVALPLATALVVAGAWDEAWVVAVVASGPAQVSAACWDT